MPIFLQKLVVHLKNPLKLVGELLINSHGKNLVIIGLNLLVLKSQ